MRSELVFARAWELAEGIRQRYITSMGVVEAYQLLGEEATVPQLDVGFQQPNALGDRGVARNLGRQQDDSGQTD